MKVNIQGHHVSITPALKEQVEQKVSRLDSHSARIISSDVLLKLDSRGQHAAEGKIRLPGKILHAKAVSNDMYASINAMAHKLQQQLQKMQGKRQKHAGKERGVTLAIPYTEAVA